jgi:GTP cyclohydrolase III
VDGVTGKFFANRKPRTANKVAYDTRRSPADAKQLASRARRRVQGAASDDDIETDVTRQRAVVVHSWPPPAVVPSTRCWRC